MNIDKVNIARAKELRGNIVETLYMTYGQDISLQVLKNSIPMGGLLPLVELKKALYYLGGPDKRYVHVEVNAEDYTSSLVWLTPVGVNLAEGDITDVGVIINE